MEHRRVGRASRPDLRLRRRRPPLRYRPDEPLVRAAAGAPEHPGRRLRLQRPAASRCSTRTSTASTTSCSRPPRPTTARRRPASARACTCCVIDDPADPAFNPDYLTAVARLRRLARQDDVRRHAASTRSRRSPATSASVPDGAAQGSSSPSSGGSTRTRTSSAPAADAARSRADARRHRLRRHRADARPRHARRRRAARFRVPVRGTTRDDQRSGCRCACVRRRARASC